MADTLGLDKPEAYQGLVLEERERRLRTYLVLSVTERYEPSLREGSLSDRFRNRAYALQRQHSIGFPGRPSFKMCLMHQFINNATSNKISSLIVHDDMEATGMMGLIQLMQLFDGFDEDVINCWNDRCNVKNGGCRTFDRIRALEIFQTQFDVYESQTSGGVSYYPLVRPDGKRISTSDLKDGQQADVLITQQWLLNRLWQLCYSHGLITADSEHTELRFEYAVAIASSTLEICKSLSLSSMEIHGVGLVGQIFPYP